MITLTEAQLSAWLSPVLWPFFRVLAVFTAAPVFSSRVFPMRSKVGLALLVDAGHGAIVFQHQPVRMVRVPCKQASFENGPGREEPALTVGRDMFATRIREG